MWDIMRVIPCCAVTGQAAGTAAALTEDFSAMDIRQLQQTLKNSGVILHERELNIGKLYVNPKIIIEKVPQIMYSYKVQTLVL